MQRVKEAKHLEDINGNRKLPIVIQKLVLHHSDNMQVDTLPLIAEMPFYLDRENKQLLQSYGPDIFEYSKELENFSIPKGFLKRHRIDLNIRTKMVDWMIEVLYAYEADHPTFFLAVHIMDTFMAKSKSVLSNNHIHFIGIVALFIASKMEDLIPLRMSTVKENIAHNNFSEREIMKQERLMLDTLNYDIVTTSTYDFIKTYILDFCHNNKEVIEKLELNYVIDQFDVTAIYLAKLIAHSSEFSHYKFIVFNLGIV
jgi:hypothetical protein